MKRRTYRLLPGLRWRGKLRVLDVYANGIAVEFSAIDSTATAERYVFYRAVLTPQQFHDWTGESLEAKP